MLHTFTQDFEKVIEGGYGDNIDTEHLSGGAKINKVFHERFPFELIKLQYDEKALHKKIGIAIRNVHGVRSGLFTPDMAFEFVVKEQINRFRGPAIQCVDMVNNELSDIIKRCTEKVKSVINLALVKGEARNIHFFLLFNRYVRKLRII